MVKQKKQGERKDKKAEKDAKWRHCQISNRRLKKPIVSCRLGRLYNKESLIEYLLNKYNKETCRVAKHVRHLKDVTELKFTEMKKNSNTDLAGKSIETTFQADYMCPIAGLEMNGHYRFVYLKTCGCVISQRAIDEIKTSNCPICSKSFDKKDVIEINPSEEEQEKLLEEISLKRKEKKRKTGPDSCSNENKRLNSSELRKPGSATYIAFQVDKVTEKGSNVYKSLFDK